MQARVDQGAHLAGAAVHAVGWQKASSVPPGFYDLPSILYLTSRRGSQVCI